MFQSFNPYYQSEQVSQVHYGSYPSDPNQQFGNDEYAQSNQGNCNLVSTYPFQAQGNAGPYEQWRQPPYVNQGPRNVPFSSELSQSNQFHQPHSYAPPPRMSTEDMLRQFVACQSVLDQGISERLKILGEQVGLITKYLESEEQLGSLPSETPNMPETLLGPMPPPPTPWSEEEPETSMDEAHDSCPQSTVHVPPPVGPQDFSFEPVTTHNDCSINSSWWSPIENVVECIPCIPHFSSTCHNPILDTSSHETYNASVDIFNVHTNIECDEDEMSDMDFFSEMEKILHDEPHVHQVVHPSLTFSNVDSELVIDETIRCVTDLDTTLDYASFKFMDLNDLGDWDQSPPLVKSFSFFIDESFSVVPLGEGTHVLHENSTVVQRVPLHNILPFVNFDDPFDLHGGSIGLKPPFDHLHKHPPVYIDPFYDPEDHVGLKHFLEHPMDDSHTFRLSFASIRPMDRIYPFPTFGIDPLSLGCLWLGYK